MMKDEELYSGRQFIELNRTRQSELITKHCAGIEERIRDAQSKEEAERVAGAACTTFESECSSSIVRDALAQHIHAKILYYWSGK